MKTLRLRGWLRTLQIYQEKMEWMIKISYSCWRLAIMYYNLHITPSQLDPACRGPISLVASNVGAIQHDVPDVLRISNCQLPWAVVQMGTYILLSINQREMDLITSFCWCKQSQREIPKECIHLVSLSTRLEANLATLKWPDYHGVVAFPRSTTSSAQQSLQIKVIKVRASKPSPSDRPTLMSEMLQLHHVWRWRQSLPANWWTNGQCQFLNPRFFVKTPQ